MLSTSIAVPFVSSQSIFVLLVQERELLNFDTAVVGL